MSSLPTMSELRQKIFGTTDRFEMANQVLFNGFHPRGLVTKETLSNLRIPYTRPGELPAPIPTPQEIVKARNQTDNNLSAFRGRFCFSQVFRVNDVYAVKVATDGELLQEAENLRYLENNCKVRAPKLYACFMHQGCDPWGMLDGPDPECKKAEELPEYIYIVMEYIPGESCLTEDYNKLSETARTNICRKMSEQIRLLREVSPPHPNYYGRIDNQGFRPIHRLLNYSGRGFHGPYHSHNAFLEDLCRQAEAYSVTRFNNEFPDLRPFEKMSLAYGRKFMIDAPGQESKLTHVDLKFEDIRVQPIPGSDDDYDVVIIDWADLGWLPSYIQAALAVIRSDANDHANIMGWELSQAFDSFPYVTALFLKTYWNGSGVYGNIR